TLAAWRLAIGDAAAPVGTYRHPAAVARSLRKRNGFDEARSHGLWLRYNAALVEAHRARPFPIVAFELREPPAYCQTVARVAGRLGLQPDRARMLEFVSAELDHAPDVREALPADCRATWEYLESVREPWAAPAAGGAAAPAAGGRARLHFVCGAVAAG